MSYLPNMSDVLSSIIALLPQTATMITGYKAAKPFLDKMLGPAAEEIGEAGRDYVKSFRSKAGAKTITQAGQMLADIGKEPGTVPLKTLNPLLESASLEDDDFLSTAWAALLANASNPDRELEVESGFVEIMKQLTPLQVQVLSIVMRRVEQTPHSKPTDILLDSASTRQLLPEISDEQFHLALDNIQRLNLCKFQGLNGYDVNKPVQGVAPGDDDRFMKLASLLFPGHAYAHFTFLGIAFIKACVPPNVTKS